MIINKVTLYTHDLAAIEDFYCIKLGFQILKKSTTVLEIKIGNSVLAFELASPKEQKQYHLAFNIPSNLFQEAKEWIKFYTSLLVEDDEDEVYFETIDAHSLYFYDPDENVIELIARHSVNPELHVKQFTAEAILSIGEMNITTDYVKEIGEQLISIGVPVRNNAELNIVSLNFMGESNSEAYILLGPSKRNWYFSTKRAVVSRTTIIVNDQLYLIVDKDGQLQYQML